eukprot:3930836-Rhodomonas_salina.3
MIIHDEYRDAARVPPNPQAPGSPPRPAAAAGNVEQAHTRAQTRRLSRSQRACGSARTQRATTERPSALRKRHDGGKVGSESAEMMYESGICSVMKTWHKSTWNGQARMHVRRELRPHCTATDASHHQGVVFDAARRMCERVDERKGQGAHPCVATAFQHHDRLVRRSVVVRVRPNLDPAHPRSLPRTASRRSVLARDRSRTSTLGNSSAVAVIAFATSASSTCRTLSHLRRRHTTSQQRHRRTPAEFGWNAWAGLRGWGVGRRREQRKGGIGWGATDKRICRQWKAQPDFLSSRPAWSAQPRRTNGPNNNRKKSDRDDHTRTGLRALGLAGKKCAGGSGSRRRESRRRADLSAGA